MRAERESAGLKEGTGLQSYAACVSRVRRERRQKVSRGEKWDDGKGGGANDKQRGESNVANCTKT